jgi:tRNA U34 5-carboxymethylaminomethyl modifying GTPase MnmE/TrmE
MSHTQAAFDFTHLDAEAYLTRRLREHGHEIFTGMTDASTRQERFRAAILEAGLEFAIVGRNAAGKTETYTQVFERLYNEPLERKPKGK